LAIRAIVLDVDGVLTDGTFWWGPAGAEWKRFSFADVMGIARARRVGCLFALVSGEDSPLVERYAVKLGIEDLFTNCKNKASALREFAARRSLDLAEIAYMGNDVNDLEAMAASGFAAAPSDAEEVARDRAAFVASRPGGRGAVRDLIGHLFPEALSAP
jgi:3-deoxy-D-manno-octulosonate 8-phosphate phosphatase (KDO 8-P phosphatase)